MIKNILHSINAYDYLAYGLLSINLTSYTEVFKLVASILACVSIVFGMYKKNKQNKK